MPPQPESVGEWLRYARSDLELAETPLTPEILPEMLCFHAQQAAEKAIKAVLILHGIRPPKIRDTGALLDRLPADVAVTDEVERARALTGYATISRYPWAGVAVTEDQYRETLGTARAVLVWTEETVGKGRGEAAKR